MKYIDTDSVSLSLRNRAIEVEEKRLLITNYSGSEQESDLTEPTNCNGFGRIRHFRLSAGDDWPSNPLPVVPVTKALGLEATHLLRTQVFQNSICNWRCWYCYVDFKLLSGNKRFSSYLTCDELVELYRHQDDPPCVIDLSGGQPDLTPEWVVWMMDALKEHGLDKSVYLWSDDNLSNNYFWRFLSDNQIQQIASQRLYSRVCCFKGIDETSFSINTKARPELFGQQFDLFHELLDVGIDLYAYVTLTAPSETRFRETVPRFVDALQEVSANLPLRTVPLKIMEFSPMKSREDSTFRDLIKGQFYALEIWQKELEIRFTSDERSTSINEVKL